MPLGSIWKLKYGGTLMLYDYTYVVVIASAPNKVIWYAKRIGESFEARRILVKGKFKYRIDYLHIVPEIDCKVVRKKATPRYTKF
jgi:hypothetical protein